MIISGSDRGLSLRLNIEQYEYMRGPNSAAGVKILVHDQEEIPLVRELGQAISPGSHAFVGIQMLQVSTHFNIKNSFVCFHNG